MDVRSPVLMIGSGPPTGIDMTTLRTDRVGRFCAVAAGIATCVAIVLMLSLAAPRRWPLVIVLVGALLWGLGGTFAVALIPTGPPSTAGERTAAGTTGPDPMGELRIGTLMYLGSVPDQVARSTSAMAAGFGPVALVVPVGRSVPIGLDPAVLVVEPDDLDAPAADKKTWGPNTMDGASALSEFQDRCDAVLVVSARAMPAPGCHEAVRFLARGASWVQGVVEPLNRDRFGPAGRETLDARLRGLATVTGLWCWEPDATIVATSLLRSHPLPVGRPMGAWLRGRAADGATGVVVASVLARRAAPVAADGYWPDTTARQSALAADLSDAAYSGGAGTRARAVAAGLLVRSLSGWSVMWWLAALVLLPDGSPVRHGGGVIAGLVVLSTVLRWLAPRLSTGVRLSPVGDVIAGLYGLPGSLTAVGSAVTRRVHAPRRGTSTRPLVWLALVATAAAASVVLTAGPSANATRVATGAAVGLLISTWVFTVRSLVERSWNRVGFRVPLDLAATVVDEELRSQHVDEPVRRIVDGGPGGFALSGTPTGHVAGDEMTVRVRSAGGEVTTLRGTVAGVRDHGNGIELIGVELKTVEPDPAAWARILNETTSSGPVRVQEPVAPSRWDWGHGVDRLAIGLVIITSIVVVFALGLLLIGVRPLVIRSGSMEPTYGVGDVVLVSSEPAMNIREGQVVTRFDAPEAIDSLTHRVQHVARSGDELQVETRGDANDTSEVWSVPAGHEVGVVVASIPGIGRPLTSVRSSVGWAFTAVIVVLAVIGVLFRPRRCSDDRRGDRPTGAATGADRHSGGFLNPVDEVPTTSPTSASGELR